MIVLPFYVEMNMESHELEQDDFLQTGRLKIDVNIFESDNI